MGVLVMQLPANETFMQSAKLGVSSAAMILLGYPGEVSDTHAVRWIFWALAMIPFVFIVYTLVVGLAKAADRDERADVALLCKQVFCELLHTNQDLMHGCLSIGMLVDRDLMVHLPNRVPASNVYEHDQWRNERRKYGWHSDRVQMLP